MPRSTTRRQRAQSPLVYCCVCGLVVERARARHLVTCWSSGKGGGLTDVRGQRTHDKYCCTTCINTRPDEAAAVAAKGA